MSYKIKATSIMTIVLIILFGCGPPSNPIISNVEVDFMPEQTETTSSGQTSLLDNETNIPEVLTFKNSGQELGIAQSWDIALGDLDGDSDLDVFVANAFQGGEQNTVWFNDGSGVFTQSDQDLDYGQGIDLGDIDGDGDLDAIISSWWGKEHTYVWINDGKGVFSNSLQNFGSSMRPSLGDFDNDGDLDLFLARLNANSVYLNDGTGVFTDTGQNLGMAITAAVGLGDLDGDGDLDILAGGWDESAKVWLNSGAGIFTTHEYNLSPGSVHIHDLALGDLDGDGDLDVFMAIASGGPNQVWFNDGKAVFTNSNQTLHSSLAHGISLGDVDGDGDLDALTSHGDIYGGSSGGLLWFNDGLGYFERDDLELGVQYCTANVFGDLNGDRNLDIILTHGDQTIENGGGIPNRVWLSINLKEGNGLE